MSISAIMLDQREPKWVQELEFGGIPTAVTLLEWGDAMLACEDGTIILVERKTLDDLLGSIQSHRLATQCAGMCEQARWSYLVITGLPRVNAAGQVMTDRGETGWGLASVMGALLAIQELGVMVTWCTSDTEYESTVLGIGARSHKDEQLILPVKFPTYLSPGEQVLASLPGIGVERIAKLVEYCGNAAWSLAGLTDRDSEIPGIPKNVKTKVRAALGLKDEEQLNVMVDAQGAEVVSVGALGSQ